MAETEDPKYRTPGVAAEPDRVPAPVALGFGFVFAAVAVVGMAISVLVFRSLQKGAEKRDAAAVAAAGLERPPDALPPVPRLQIYPVMHWKDFERAEQARLSGYGWIDRASGVAYIPIDRAIEIVAERGVGPLPPAPMPMPGGRESGRESTGRESGIGNREPTP